MRYCSDNSPDCDGGFPFGLRQWCTLLIATVLLLPQLDSAAAADEPATNGPQTEPPKLQPVFGDDFTKDTRGDYEIKGDVSWEEGKLTLAEGASITREVNGGPWAKLEIGLIPKDLPDDASKSEVRLWLNLESGVSCYVRLLTERKETEVTRSLAVVKAEHTGGFLGFGTELQHNVIRSIDRGGREVGELKIEYQYGLIKVHMGDEPPFAAYLRSTSEFFTKYKANVDSVRLEVVNRPTRVEHVSINATQPDTREFTIAERQQLSAANVLGTRALLLAKLGLFKDAAEAAERWLAIKRTVAGPWSLSYAESSHDVAGYYKTLRNYSIADSLYRESLEIHRSIVGEHHPQHALVLGHLAKLHIERGNYIEATQVYLQLLAIKRLVFGKQHPEYADGLAELANLYEIRGDYNRALSFHIEAAKVRKAVLGVQHRDFASSMRALAWLEAEIGNLADARKLARGGADILNSTVGEKKDPAILSSLNTLGVIEWRAGNYPGAVTYLTAALDGARILYGNQHLDHASALANLGAVHFSMGDLDRAESLTRQAMQIREAIVGTQHLDYADCLHNLAAIYDGKKQYEQAIKFYTGALDIRAAAFGRQHPKCAATLLNLGLTYESSDDYESAERLLREATKIYRVTGGEDHREYAGSLASLAACQCKTQNYVEAESLYERAIEIVTSTVGPNSADYARQLNGLAVVYSRTDRHEQATPLYRQSVKIVRKNLEVTAAGQSSRQQVLNQDQARWCLENRLMNVLVRAHRVSESLLDMWQWKGAVTSRQQAYRRVASNPTLAPLFQELQSVTRQLAAHSNRTPIPPRSGAEESEQTSYEENKAAWEKRFTELNDRREELERKIADGSEEFRRVQEPLEVAEVQKLLPQNTAYIDLLEYSHSEPNPDEPGEFHKERRYIAFVVRPGTEPAMLSIGGAAELHDLVTTFRRPFLDEQDTLENQQAAQKAAGVLRERLWLPLEEHLDGIETVIISPDTMLGTLPFAALPGRTDGSYLIENYRIAILPLAAMFRSLIDSNVKRPQAEQGLLVVGDVDYDRNAPVAQTESGDAEVPPWMRRSAARAGPNGWQPLPGFQQELAIVRDHFESKFGGGVTTLRKDKATEAEFIEEAGRHYNLHVITHGFFADPEFEAIGTGVNDKPLSHFIGLQDTLAGSRTVNQYLPGVLSGIVLAGANSPPSADKPEADGILTASEIETLDFNAVDLVVLSACETGLGKVAGGEGLTGLQRAFHIAGARSCIASLWEVEDKATQEIMSRFYRYYWHKGQSKIDALRNAQLDLLRNPTLVRGLTGNKVEIDPNKPAPKPDKFKRLDPRYWAAFQLSGDWR